MFRNVLLRLQHSGLRNIPGIVALYNRLYSLLIRIRSRRLVVKVDGQEILVDRDDLGVSRRLLLFGDHLPHVTRFMKREIKEGMIVVDVGAKIGYNTLLASQRVGASGHVYAFEPDPRTFELLAQNISRNRHENTTVVNKALSNTPGTLTVHLDKRYLSSTSISKNNIHKNLGEHSRYGSQMVVETTTLDAFLHDTGETPRLDVLKLNIQGAEGLAIDGAAGVLRSNDNICIITEFWAEGLRECGTDPGELLLRLKSLGFELEPVEGLGKGVYGPGDALSLDTLVRFFHDPQNRAIDEVLLVFRKRTRRN